MTKAMKTVRATMTWKGRRLLCNGVCVAWIFDVPRLSATHPVGYTLGGDLRIRYSRNESSARRAVNKRFGLPLDFGARP